MRAIEPSFEAVDALRLRTAMRRPLNELSTGTIVKVLIASAVAGQPGLLICDEPFADLDIDARDTVRGMLARLRANGSGILLTDHSDTSHALADRELRITDGALR
jgi:ABC-type Mn2+/Zn2+ transport system ATPase subunit